MITLVTADGAANGQAAIDSIPELKDKVCLRVCMVCVHECMHECDVCVCVCAYVCIYAECGGVCVCVCAYVCIYAEYYVCMYAHSVISYAKICSDFCDWRSYTLVNLVI